MIASLEDSRRQAEKDAEETEVQLSRSTFSKRGFRKKLAELEQKKEKLEQKAKEKAKKIVDDARREAEEVISELRKMQANTHMLS